MNDYDFDKFDKFQKQLISCDFKKKGLPEDTRHLPILMLK